MTYRFWLGLDLGQAQDYTALAVLERRALAPDRGGAPRGVVMPPTGRSGLGNGARV